MQTPLTPSGIAAPAARYAHAVLVSDAARWLHTSGVVPVAPDGSVPETISDQAATVWANLTTILSTADMSLSDIVSMTTYVVNGQSAHLPDVMAARDVALNCRLVASTLVEVAALARPEWLVEVAVVAAR